LIEGIDSPIRHIHDRISITITGELKAIREQLKLTPDEITRKVGAKTAAEILAYENDEDDLLVTISITGVGFRNQTGTAEFCSVRNGAIRIAGTDFF
jgi:hypothetical protein